MDEVLEMGDLNYYKERCYKFLSHNEFQTMELGEIGFELEM